MNNDMEFPVFYAFTQREVEEYVHKKSQQGKEYEGFKRIANGEYRNSNMRHIELYISSIDVGSLKRFFIEKGLNHIYAETLSTMVEKPSLFNKIF